MATVNHYKTIYLAPRVLIFAEKKQDVDNIHEYLLLKGVAVASIHGGKGRLYAYNCCSSGEVIPP